METATKKEIGIDIFLIIFTTLLFWLFVSTNLLINNPYVSLVFIFAVPIWIACLAIALTLVSNYSAAILSLLIPVILVVVGMAQMEIIVAAIIIIGLLLSARFSFVHELKSRVQYKTRTVFYSGTKLLAMSVIVLITGISMPHITESIMSDEIAIPESAIRLMLKPYEPYLAQNLPGGSLDTSIEETIEIQLQKQFPGNSREATMQREIAREQKTAQLSEQFQQEIKPSDDVSTIVARVINDQINTITDKYPMATPLAIFGLIVFVSRLILPPISLLFLLSVAGHIWLFRKTNLIKLLSVSMPVEHLEL